ncbi:hypothetical protein RND71_033912 [Anisodus tanguticus]|uniref:Uncharacterized protein n=1 Tax=Anisodus tanguticus TaxID=243964 RepID=A0AAE1UWJ9_9SOLA|nr:hypothetical protein RND71_033912 [Anisodus tanguticus]
MLQEKLVRLSLSIPNHTGKEVKWHGKVMCPSGSFSRGDRSTHVMQRRRGGAHHTSAPCGTHSVGPGWGGVSCVWSRSDAVGMASIKSLPSKFSPPGHSPVAKPGRYKALWHGTAWVRFPASTKKLCMLGNLTLSH